jgi:hypothetical protein
MEGCVDLLGPVPLPPDAPFDFRHIIVAGGQLGHRTTWQGLDQSLQRCEFAVRMHRRDAKAALEIILVDLLEGLVDLRDSSVREVVDRRKAYLAAQC